MRLQQNAPQFDVASGLDQKINVRRDNVVRLARRHHGLNSLEGAGCSYVIEGHAQQRHRRRAQRCGGRGRLNGDRSRSRVPLPRVSSVLILIKERVIES